MVPPIPPTNAPAGPPSPANGPVPRAPVIPPQAAPVRPVATAVLIPAVIILCPAGSFTYFAKYGLTALPDTNFVTSIVMSSSEFQKICREAYNIADIIELKSSGNQLILSCSGDFASQLTTYSHTDSGVSFKHSEDKKESEIIQGYYSLSHLSLFSKCGNLCQSIQLYLENERPLIIEYSVGNLGKLLLVIAPKVDD